LNRDGANSAGLATTSIVRGILPLYNQTPRATTRRLVFDILQKQNAPRDHSDREARLNSIQSI